VKQALTKSYLLLVFRMEFRPVRVILGHLNSATFPNS